MRTKTSQFLQAMDTFSQVVAGGYSLLNLNFTKKWLGLVEVKNNLLDIQLN